MTRSRGLSGFLWMVEALKTLMQAGAARTYRAEEFGMGQDSRA